MKKKLSKSLAVFLSVLMVLTSLPLTVIPVSAIIPDRLDGDTAYLYEFGLTTDEDTESGFSIKTGNSPWDDDDKPGNDSSPNNNVVRTYDTITYETFFTTRLFPQGKSIIT